MRQQQLWIKLSVLLILITFLSSCSIYPANGTFYTVPNKGVPVGAITGAAIGAASGVGFITPFTTVMGGLLGGALYESMLQRKPIIEKLRAFGIYVVYWGYEVKIIIPSDIAFYCRSTNPSPLYYPAMDLIVQLLRGIDKITIKVAAYTDAASSPIRDKVLTRQQAQTISSHLWGRGVDARLMYAVGCGQENPIANNITAKGQGQNRRIEITLRKITVLSKTPTI